MDRLLQTTIDANLAEPPYADNSEYLMDEMKRLDLLLRISLIRQSGRTLDPALDSAEALGWSEELLTTQLHALNTCIHNRKILSMRQSIHLSLPYLAQLFQLSDMESIVLLVGLSPELDPKYEKLFARLQEDPTALRPSVHMVQRLLQTISPSRVYAQSIFDSTGKLLKYQLLHYMEPDETNYLLSRHFYVDPQIVRFLIGIEQLDGRLEGAAYFAPHREDPDMEWLHQDVINRIRSLIEKQLTPNGGLEQKLMFVLAGEPGSGKQRVAESVCRKLGISLLIGDIAVMLHHPTTFTSQLFLLCREAHIHPSALCLLHTNSLFEQPEQHRKEIAAFLDMIEKFPNLTFVLGNKPRSLLRSHGNGGLIEVDVKIPGHDLRKKLWERLADRVSFEHPPDFDAIAEKFSFTPGRIQNVLFLAQRAALWRNPEHPKVSLADLQASCYSQTEHHLYDGLADKLLPSGTFRDLIVPAEQAARLQELIDQVKYRRIVHGEWGFGEKLRRGKGLNILLHGPPGTGKTMAAEVIAGELGLDLYRIDLSQVVSKYIGETEKNLHRIFQAAEQSYAILFFDEADALFGKRTDVKDALDRHANTEIAFLLQKMEEYDGITILATNLLHNLDAAFIRRMQFSIEFPIPDESSRRDIWKAMFPADAPKSEEIDYDFLAQRFKVSGGHIKNIVLSAAFLAAKQGQSIGMAHLIPALKREMDKSGKLTSKEDFSPYYTLLGGD
ncbi:ATP-binding protein [Paenibacillus spongiae]|uniref:AAA family ATPase n=1 Tax=Paenibacillus spongiae TaxID=2909671 RepID=A0ABY5S493_9BACL|nr:AAA family ATPase [Paenibacillus spongiae]UVI27375.1 AAA family ATPase [Paenibacillus spongiae]